MSSNFGAGKAIELVERLRSVIGDTAAREEELEREFLVRINKERERREAATGAETRALTAALEEAEAAFQAAREAAIARHARRKARINKGRGTSKELGIERVDARMGSRKYELQKQMLQAERDRDAGLTAAAQTRADFDHLMAVELAALTPLEQSAQEAFKGYGRFRRLFERAYDSPPENFTQDETQLLTQLRELLAAARADIAHFRRFFLARLFKLLPLWVILALAPLTVPWLPRLGIAAPAWTLAQAAGVVAGCLGALVILHWLGRRQAGSLAAAISTALGRARRLHAACLEKAAQRHERENLRLRDEFRLASDRIDWGLKKVIEEAAEARVACRMTVDQKSVRAAARNEVTHRARLEHVEREHHEGIARLQSQGEARLQAASADSRQKEERLNADWQRRSRELAANWREKTQAIQAEVNALNARADGLFPPWTADLPGKWTPARQFADLARFGQLQVEPAKLADRVPKGSDLAVPGPPRFTLPLMLEYPGEGSVLLESAATGREEMIAALNNIVLRLLAAMPPGRLQLTVIDPVGLGESFAGIMHLADYEEQLINGRIWTQTGQIEERLGELNAHIEKVIQMYLRNEYATLAEYNAQAGDIAERYHFLVVADFPANFSDAAARRLMSIAASGARCGVFTLMHWDQRQPAPPDFLADEFRKSSVGVSVRGGKLRLAGLPLPGTDLLLDPPPPPEVATEFIHRVGRGSRDSTRVEVPFANVAPAEDELWTSDTTGELRVPIGRTGATKLQYLAIGKGTRQHALIAGKTGSGKSTLFHVIITNLALWCSPEQVEFYLIDFKKGVEFKCYASRKLPHARVVAIESDREFALSVLQRVDAELRRRGELFRKLGAQDLAGYKRAGGTEPLPRTLLLIDEFQEYFTEDDKISQSASVLLDRIVRQGRAFGIHVILGSQTLGGAYTVARTTLGQMVIRIALQCNEADAYLIMDDTNPAPRLLSRPGEGIYNDAAGALAANSPFQTVWLPDDVRDASLDLVLRQAAKEGKTWPAPIVFEGDAPADVRENEVLAALLRATSVTPAVSSRIWLGAPNSIKGPTEAVFHRQAGNNLLIVGQREDAVMAILSIGLVSLAAQFPPGAARFILFHGTPPGAPQREFLDNVLRVLPHSVSVAKHNELPELMSALAAEMKRRSGEEHGAEAPATFLIFHDLQKFTRLRYEEDFSFSSPDTDAPANPAAQLNEILCEGASRGFHVVAALDTYNNVNRFISKKAFSEFEMRVLFQMSANDSANLIDNPRANTLGLHRALFYNEQEGYLEVFRPYALPGRDWIEEAGRDLARLAGKEPDAPR